MSGKVVNYVYWKYVYHPAHTKLQYGWTLVVNLTWYGRDVATASPLLVWAMVVRMAGSRIYKYYATMLAQFTCHVYAATFKGNYDLDSWRP